MTGRGRSANAIGAVTGSSRLRRTELLARRLDKPAGGLAVIFLFVVLAQLVATEPAVVSALTVVGWLFWAVYLDEFLVTRVPCRVR